jgi:hypothetical protein
VAVAAFSFPGASLATETYQVQLERVQAAIAAIESGTQAHSVAGRTFTKADLATLYTRERWLRGMADREERGSIRVTQAVPLG